MRVCLGGTFDPFHVGHEALLGEAARDADHIFVGVTEGERALRRDREVAPWDERAARVEAFLQEAAPRVEVVTNRLTDGMGPAAGGDYDAIVVSPETVVGADQINATRRKTGLAPLAVRVVEHVLADDLLPVSSTRIHAGDIDRRGKRLTDVRVAVGSTNPVKVAAVEAEVGRLLGLPVSARGFEAESGVPEQPKEGEILAGARRRAQAAMASWPAADYAVGVEAGLSRDPDEAAWYDVQACVALDRSSAATEGWGPAFRYPDWVTQRALKGEMVSDILGPVAKDPRIGGTTGAIGFLTDGRMDRTELTCVAVLMAFVPRIRPGLYRGGDASTAPS